MWPQKKNVNLLCTFQRAQSNVQNRSIPIKDDNLMAVYLHNLSRVFQIPNRHCMIY